MEIFIWVVENYMSWNFGIWVGPDWCD